MTSILFLIYIKYQFIILISYQFTMINQLTFDTSINIYHEYYYNTIFIYFPYYMKIEGYTCSIKSLRGKKL